MRIYATVTSERDSRPAKKGADEFLQIDLAHGNKRHTSITFDAGDGSLIIEGVNKKIITLTPFDLGHT